MRSNAPQAEWIQGAITVERTGTEARREFIRKTYVHFLLGLMAFCCLVWGAISSDAVMGAVAGIPFYVWLIAMVGLSIGYRWFFASANISTHYLGFGLTIASAAFPAAQADRKRVSLYHSSPTRSGSSVARRASTRQHRRYSAASTSLVGLASMVPSAATQLAPRAPSAVFRGVGCPLGAMPASGPSIPKPRRSPASCS